MDAADTNYAINPWMQNVPVTDLPTSTYEQQITSAALAPTMGESADSIRQRRPPLPIQAFPKRFGYREEVLGIADVANVDSIYERVDFSGKKSGYEGTSTPSLPAF